MNMIIKRTEKQKPQKKYKHWYLRGFFAMQLQCRVRGAVSHMFNRCVSYSRRRDPGFPSKAPTTNEIPHSAARGALGPAHMLFMCVHCVVCFLVLLIVCLCFMCVLLCIIVYCAVCHISCFRWGPRISI